MHFTDNYLRVLTPKTTNGVIPLLVNGELQYKETFLPFSARKQLDKKNQRLINAGHSQLVAIIEPVGEDVETKPRNPKPRKLTK